ncbi:transposase [Morganella morganii subsp. morganii]|uniref:transposase n=2 Tax=Morganella morganii TaxID=582 RepID=UPI001330BFED|nr:transposase [Morganella morganii subsp. morganii]
MVKQYSAEFKLEAAKMVVDHHYSVAKAAQAMGVSLAALNRWVNRLNEWFTVINDIIILLRITFLKRLIGTRMVIMMV